MQIPANLWPALFSASTGKAWPPLTAEEIETFIRDCAAESLLPILQTDDSIPAAIQEARKPFAALLPLQKQRTQILVRALQRIGEILEGEDFALLKGADYAFRLYPQPYLRPMSDIDLLVPAARMPEVCRRFFEAGMQQHFPAGTASRLKSHHETVFTLNGVLIEPHHSFIQRARHRIDYDGIWRRRIAFHPAGVRTFRLADADALIYQTLRMATDQFNEPLIHYLDFYLLLHRFEGDLETLAGRAREYRTERALYAAFRQLTRLFPELHPRTDALLESLLSPSVRRHLDERVLPARFIYRRIARREQLWRKFNLMDGYRERLGFLFYWAYAAVAGRFVRSTRPAS